MSSTTAKWAPSLMWTCRRELVKRPQPRACLRDTYGIAFRREAGDRDLPGRLGHELVIARHLKFRAHDRQHQLPQFRLTEKPVRRMNIEMANELGEYIIGLRVGRQADAEFRQLQQIPHHTLFEAALVADPVRRARSRGEQMLRS